MSFQLTKRLLPLSKQLISSTKRKATIITTISTSTNTTTTTMDESKKSQEWLDIHALYNNENQSAMEYLYHQPSPSSVHYAAGHPHHSVDAFSPRFNTVFDE
ncbi:unnamed protein product [Cunninghamella echinulata]